MPDSLQELLDSWGLDDFDLGRRNYFALQRSLGQPEWERLQQALTTLLPSQADPDMALNNLERFFAVPEAHRHYEDLLANHSRGLQRILQLFSTSQFFSDWLITHPEDLDILWLPLRHTPTREQLIERLRNDVAAAADDASILRTLRAYRQKQHLRIGVNDIIRDRPLEEITRDLSTVADACLEVTLETAWRTCCQRFGCPEVRPGEPSRVVILAFGKLGGEELNYSSDIDLMFVYDEEGQTNGRRPVDNSEFYSRLVQEVVRLLSAHTDRGQAYRVDLRLRPEGQRGALARSLPSTLSYYDTLGRTWERQALIKVRPVAGDRILGNDFLRAIEPFVYHKYLSFAEINEIKAMKRRIEHQAQQGRGERDVKTGPGGIRDVEFTIQFLQLLNGADLPAIRQRGTLNAIQALATTGCLTYAEYQALDDAYRFLRETEHRLQILFDWQTHCLPEKAEELRKLALRMGYSDRGGARIEAGRESSVMNSVGTDAFRQVSPQKQSPLDEVPTLTQMEPRPQFTDPLDAFLHDYQEKSRLNRTILDHILHQTFADSDERAEPETDLILAPEPDEATIQGVLGRYPFKDVMGAYRNLSQLAQESGPFLSTPRCRHFLASILPQLLRVIAETPDPDLALLNLEKVTASLGAKAVLWELFSFNTPSLRLYVDICSNSPFLSQILINNPGMIDDLLDSLILNQPRTAEELRSELRELVRGVDRPEVVEPIVHSFQDKELLRIGVRDLLGKDGIRETTAALSDLAETILVDSIMRQEANLIKRAGVPILAEGSRAGQLCRHVVLALGKLGGREMSYHSDLDLVLIYEGDGRSLPTGGADSGWTTPSLDHHHYFTELAQRIIKAVSQAGPLGRLYEVDMRLRPMGQSSSLVIPLAEFRRYYLDGPAQIWERQSLTRARVVHGAAEFASEVMSVVNEAIDHLPWKPEIIDEIRAMRERLEASASSRSLKRGRGGLVDVEFLVQMFRLKYGRRWQVLHTTNTWDALESLLAVGLIDSVAYQECVEGYSFLRRAEARLRIVTNRPLNEYPEGGAELEKFARRMGFEGKQAGEQFRSELRKRSSVIRGRFEELFARERRDG